MRTFNMLFASFRISNTVTANRIIHFLARFPFLRGAMQSMYGEYSLKNTIIGIATVYKVIKRLFMRFFYVACLLVGTFFVMEFGNIGETEMIVGQLISSGFTGEYMELFSSYFMHIWFVMSFIGASINSTLIDANPHDETMILSMRANPTVYAKANIIFDRVTDLLLYAPYLILLFSLLKIPLLGVLNILLVYTACRLLGECVNMALYSRFKITFRNYSLVYTVGALAVAYAFVLPAFLQIPQWRELLISTAATIISIPIGVLAGIYIAQYKKYDTLVRSNITLYTQQLEKAKRRQKRNSTIGGVTGTEKWAKDVQKERIDSSKYENKRGFAYLNAIFFDRHRKFFYKKTRLRIVIIVLLGIAACLAIFMMRTFFQLDPMEIMKVSNPQGSRPHSDYVSIFFFIIYFVSMGRIITGSVFSNCDIEMLNYPYYTKPKNILRSFKARFAYILKNNLAITTVIAVTVTIVSALAAGYVDWIYAGVLLLTLTSIGVFFAFSDLFIYYVIQPYDSAADVKSIAYKAINFVIYLIAYANLQLPVDFFIYSAVITGATCVYVIVGSILLQKIAPKTFKLR